MKSFYGVISMCFFAIACLAAEPVPEFLLGTWVTDHEATMKSRAAVPPGKGGTGFDPAAKIPDREVTFTPGQMVVEVEGVTFTTPYEVFRREENEVFLKYKGEGSHTFTLWEFPSRDTAINYVIVFDKDSPDLTDKTIKTFYRRAR